MRAARDVALAASVAVALIAIAAADARHGEVSTVTVEPAVGDAGVRGRDAGGAGVDPGAASGRAPRWRGVAIGPPARLTIPAIGVVAPVTPLGLLADGRLAAPRAAQVVGWWSAGPRPGRPGAAVLAGHVDSRTGPGAFAGLARLRRGDVIRIADRAGRSLRFRVTTLETHRKERFPTHRVYRRTHRPLLRLVTCAGRFDRARGHYDDNLIVYGAIATRDNGG